MFSGRSVENEIRRRHVARGADRLKRISCLLVEVQISVVYLADLFFRAVSRSFSYWIHANENVGSREILLLKPGLEGSARNGPGRKNTLRRFAAECDSSRELLSGRPAYEWRKRIQALTGSAE